MLAGSLPGVVLPSNLTSLGSRKDEIERSANAAPPQKCSYGVYQLTMQVRRLHRITVDEPLVSLLRSGLIAAREVHRRHREGPELHLGGTRGCDALTTILVPW